ncbi:hypothetical protein AAMO2058_001670800 [Amorphochlora amoebiformis]
MHNTPVAKHRKPPIAGSTAFKSKTISYATTLIEAYLPKGSTGGPNVYRRASFVDPYVREDAPMSERTQLWSRGRRNYLSRRDVVSRERKSVVSQPAPYGSSENKLSGRRRLRSRDVSSAMSAPVDGRQERRTPSPDFIDPHQVHGFLGSVPKRYRLTTPVALRRRPMQHRYSPERSPSQRRNPSSRERDEYNVEPPLYYPPYQATRLPPLPGTIPIPTRQHPSSGRGHRVMYPPLSRKQAPCQEVMFAEEGRHWEPWTGGREEWAFQPLDTMATLKRSHHTIYPKHVPLAV